MSSPVWWDAESIDLRSRGKGEESAHFEDVQFAMFHGFLIIRLETPDGDERQKLIVPAERVSAIIEKKRETTYPL